MTRRIDVSDYLLGELSADDRAEAERLMREDPRFRAEVERLRPVVSRLEQLPPAAWEAPEPPPLVLPQAEPVPGPDRRSLLDRLRGGIVLRPAVAAACSLALVAAGVAAGVALDSGDGVGDQPDGAAQRFAMAPFGDAAPSAVGVAEVSESGGDRVALVRVRGLRPSSPGDFYELWLLDDAEAPSRLISLGSFRVPASGEASVEVPVPVDPRRFVFDVSVEPQDGDPAHSGDSVLRAPA